MVGAHHPRDPREVLADRCGTEFYGYHPDPCGMLQCVLEAMTETERVRSLAYLHLDLPDDFDAHRTLVAARSALIEHDGADDHAIIDMLRRFFWPLTLRRAKTLDDLAFE